MLRFCNSCCLFFYFCCFSIKNRLRFYCNDFELFLILQCKILFAVAVDDDDDNDNDDDC